MATYADIIDAMIEARNKGFTMGELEKVVLDEETMENFLTDDSFTEEVEERQKNTIGTDWRLKIESGDDNYLVADDGTQFSV